ncbi:Regulator of G-protein signaling 9 [Holothuria leucospilota]|uniref:Regulator of G-protein signaling 9 n=1 Tax=Holothuria leucospilota TaxID=206669 RepID=A0A9Q1C387_HOLLE|nr:Regulator of G-protein signaling 9 [Holothuria leucospilota]
MEQLVRDMQHPNSGIPTKSQKVFLSFVPCAFTGSDLAEWIRKQLKTDDSIEAMHIATMMYRLGYIYPVDTTKVTSIKDDNCLYRFQSPYFWPSHERSHDNTDYAIFLAKRFMRSKQVTILEDYEQTAYNNLQRLLSHKWEFILFQAQEQNRIAKQRKTADRIIMDAQERAFWRIHYPPPGHTSALQSDIRRKNSYACLIHQNNSLEASRKKVLFLQRRLHTLTMKSSKAIESLMKHCSRYAEHDPMVSGTQPSNPWISDDTTLWTLNTTLVETPTERRIRRWAISLRELLADATGRHEFAKFLKKEFSEENIAFWEECENLKSAPQSSVPELVHDIYRKYLAPGAPSQINIDGHTTDMTQQCLRNPSRFAFEAAQLQILLLMQKDSYPRFLRSDHFKELLRKAMNANPRKNRFFTFGYPFNRHAKVAPDLTPFAMRRKESEDSQVEDTFVITNGGGLTHSLSASNLKDFELAQLYTHQNGDSHHTSADNNQLASRFGTWQNTAPLKPQGPKIVSTIDVPPRRMSDSSLEVSDIRSTSMVMSVPLPSIQTLIAPWEAVETSKPL